MQSASCSWHYVNERTDENEMQHLIYNNLQKNNSIIITVRNHNVAVLCHCKAFRVTLIVGII